MDERCFRGVAGDVWIVIGHKERRSAVSVDLSVVTSAAELAGAGTPLAFYHLHPFHEDSRAIEPPSLQDVQSLALMKELYGPVGSFYARHAVANEQGARGRRKTIVKVERRTTVSPGQSNINAGGN